MVGGGVYIFSQYNKKNVYIDSFEVSDSLAKQDITGIWVANQLLDKVAIIRETKLDRYKKEYLNLLIINPNSEIEEATDPKVNYKVLEIAIKKNTKFPDIGTLITNINRLLRKSLRLRDIEISGAMILTEDLEKKLKLTISSTGKTPQIIFGKVEGIVKLLLKAAEYVCKYSDPYSLALYQYISEPKTTNARYLDTIQSILANNDVTSQITAYNFWAWFLIDQGNHEKAELILRRAYKLAPNNMELLCNLANLLVQSERFVDAEEIYNKIISLGEDESFIWNNRGWLYNSWGRYDEAIPKLERALELDNKNAGAYVNLGISLKNTGKITEAKEAHFKAVKIDETNWLAYYNLGLCYMIENAYEKAAKNFKIAIKHFPNFAHAYHELGKILFYQVKLDDALKMFNKAIEIDNSKIEIYLSRCRCLLELQEFSKTMNDVEETPIMEPSNVEIYFCNGLSLLGKEDYKNAISRFEKGFTHDQTYKMRIPRKIAAAYNNFGTQLRSEKKYDEAFQMFKKAREFNPIGNVEIKNLASAYYNQGILANTRKQYKKAEKYYREAIQLDPHLAEAYHNLGNILRERAELVVAEKLLKKADQLKPNTAEILFSLGETHRLLKKDAEAKSAYRRAIELNPIYKVGALAPSRYYPEFRDW
jgi:tetratricopeptide (TPR) repeat protein